MKYKVFIDGSAGTTGLKIESCLNRRDDIKIINIQNQNRKNVDERLAKIDEADISFLCLPDSAANEIAEAAPENARIIDTSTVHRVAEGWVYGLPELCPSQRGKIRNAHRVANPGCHATGFILLVRPLIENGIIDTDYPLSATSVTGYSGGGKKMIAEYEEADRPECLKSPGQYALSQTHKHIPEMVSAAGLSAAPAFSPIVGDFYSGMTVTVPLHRDHLKTTAGIRDLCGIYEDFYRDETMVNIADNLSGGTLYGDAMAGRNDAEIYVYGSDDIPLLTARYDNLGKGASGAAMQNMNIMLGIEETKGLL